MAGSDSVREVLAGASGRLRDAGRMDNATHSADVAQLHAAAGYASGVIDMLTATLADQDRDEIEQMRDADERDVEPEGAPSPATRSRPRDGSTGRFLPRTDAEAAIDRIGGSA